MDKAEYQQKLEEIQDNVNKRDYQKAYEIAEGIDWKRVKSLRTLNMVADIYDINKDYEGEKEVLLNALSKSSIGKGVLSRLTETCIKLEQIPEAEKYFEKYKSVAAKDSNCILLSYKIAKAKGKDLSEQIHILERYKDVEYTERWSYELALLYSKAGDKRKCIDTCDDMILWFGEGKYVLKAIELKKRYTNLTPAQEGYYQKEQRDADPRLFGNTGELVTAAAAVPKLC